MLRPTVGAGHLPVLYGEAELGRDHHLIPMSLERTAKQFLVGEGAINLGGIKEGHAELDRPVYRRHRFRIVEAAIRLAHAHAAEAKSGDFEALGSKHTAL